MKISCSSWSHHRTFAAGRMDQMAWLRECAELGFDGVELLFCHFPNTDAEYLKSLKRTCTELFLTIPMVSAGGHLTVADDAERADDIEDIRKWVEIASFLGAPRVRFFCGSGEELAAGGEERYRQVLDAVRKVVALGESHGIVMALENHGGTTAEQILALHNDVDSPFMKLTLDVGNFPPVSRIVPESYTNIEKCAPLASIVHAKFFDVADDGSDNELDWGRVRDILSNAAFGGFLSLEYEGEMDDEVAIVRKIVPFLKSLR